jgi:predicted transcriptional regulator
MKTITITELRESLNLSHQSGSTWRNIARDYGINVAYIYRLARYDIEPKNAVVRNALGLPKKCFACKRKFRRIIQVKSLWDYPVSLLKFMYLNREEF